MAPRILVIEDDPAISELITYHLQREGMQVLTAADGRRALELFNANHPDLLVLDLMLPVLDGFEVCRRVRQVSDVPIKIGRASCRESVSRPTDALSCTIQDWDTD